jgi:hypothetical protein
VAHNDAWEPLFAKIKKYMKTGWESWLDKVIANTEIPCQRLTKLKPDGILRNQESEEMFLLEFKRTSDFFTDSLDRGFLRKWIKYTPLVEALQEANPRYKITLLIFVLGDRGFIDETQWWSNWKAMGLKEASFKSFCIKAALAAQEVADTTLAVYSAAVKNMNAKPSTST